MDKEVNNLIVQQSDGNFNLVSEDGEKLTKASIDKWYDVTQRLIKLLYKVKSGYRLDNNEQRIFNDAVKAFGWGNQIKTGEFNQKTLDPDSPYLLLSVLYDIERTYTKEQRESLKEAVNVSCLVNSAPEDEASQAEYRNLKTTQFMLLAQVSAALRDLDEPRSKHIDISSDVQKLYLASEYYETKVHDDIEDIPVLKERYDDLLQKLDNIKTISRYPESNKEWIKNEIIYKALSIGYTAGINANTTETLRRMNGSNNSSEA